MSRDLLTNQLNEMTAKYTSRVQQVRLRFLIVL